MFGNFHDGRLDCKWRGQSIIVLDSVRIDPPYTTQDCRSLDGDQPGLDRALLMVSLWPRAGGGERDQDAFR